MTRETSESFGFGPYVVGVFDLLGQRCKLRAMPFPPRSAHETDALLRKLDETIKAVAWLRQLFQQAPVARTQRDDLDDPRPRRILSWSLSDACALAVPVAVDPSLGPPAVVRGMADVCRLFDVAAVAWVASMAGGHPLRGGVELGTGATMPGGDVYGHALVAAHELECQAAKSPRIVVGETLVAVLKHFSSHSHQNSYAERAAEYARNCCSLLRKECDGEKVLTVLDPLGSWLTVRPDAVTRKVFSAAHKHVKTELKHHAQNKNEKLVSRYTDLLSYFNDHAKRWAAQ